MTVSDFGRAPAGGAQLYTLQSEGVRLSVTDFGARVVSLVVADRSGKPVDVVLGYDSAEEYVTNGGYIGATCGRYANRIAGGIVSVNGRDYALTVNDGANALHGGADGFDSRIWSAEPIDDGILFSLVSPHLDQGFPGELRVTVSYILESNAVKILYRAVSDEDTFVSLTNHAYFDLTGAGLGADVLLTLYAERYTPVDGGLIPIGGLCRVEGTPFDFTTPKNILTA